jgi:putative DNA methylase
MRSILLAAVMEGEATDHEFWANYRSEAPLLKGLRVHDPFMGGGTTLIEASRLGAAVSGTDVDPTAEMIVSHSLEPAQDSEVAHVGEAWVSCA